MKTINKIIPERVVIYARDIENITGRKEDAAHKYMQRMRKKFGKEKHQFISVKEFCLYSGIDEEVVREFLRS